MLLRWKNIACLSAIIFALIYTPGCSKEYSYEGGVPTPAIAPTIPAKPDSTKKPSIEFPICKYCQDKPDLPISTWSFKIDKNLFCGNVTRAVITRERNAFTFFGPSSCSGDTGLIMTVYLMPDVLKSDKQNVTGKQVSFEYYDRNNSTKIFKSWIPQAFSFVVEQYNHQASTATGRFSGNAYTEKGDTLVISNGRFHVNLVE
jgi:hypothetical protein